ncbi:hypothetical protein Tco_0662283 [Tanacetum coccineum]
MGTPTQVCVWSCPNFSAPAGRPFRCVSDIWLLISGDAKPVKDNPKEDLVDYPSKEEEEEPLASADSASPVPDSITSSEETKPFEEGETAATPPSPTSPHHIIPLSETRLRKARMSVQPQTPLPSPIEACIVEYAIAPAPPSPPPSLLSPLPSLLPRILSSSLILPSPDHREIILEANIQPQKRARFDTLTHRFEIGESSAAAAARQPMSTLARGIDYGFMTALEEVKESVTDLASSHRLGSKEFHTRY